MTDTIIVVPLKSPEESKQRLSGILSPDQRYELALCLMDHVIQILKLYNNEAELLLITDSNLIEDRYKDSKTHILIEDSPEGETRAIETATAWTCSKGFQRQIILPGDIPLLTSQDVETILSTRVPPPSVVLSPATGDDGTNVIIASPPDVITYRFGIRSFPGYISQAKRKSLKLKILQLDNMVLDLDTPDDLATFMAKPGHSPALDLLTKWNIPGRLESSGLVTNLHK